MISLQGLVGNVTVGTNTVLSDWMMFPLNFTKLFDSYNYRSNPV